MVNVAEIIVERDRVIQERRKAFSKWTYAHADDRKSIYWEFIQPLNQKLCSLNRELGL